MEYLLVKFKESRGVLANGNNVGATNSALTLPTDEYIITLDGAQDYAPSSQDVILAGTSSMRPKTITFTQLGTKLGA